MSIYCRSLFVNSITIEHSQYQLNGKQKNKNDRQLSTVVENIAYDKKHNIYYLKLHVIFYQWQAFQPTLLIKIREKGRWFWQKI